MGMMCPVVMPSGLSTGHRHHGHALAVGRDHPRDVALDLEPDPVEREAAPLARGGEVRLLDEAAERLALEHEGLLVLERRDDRELLGVLAEDLEACSCRT